MKPEAFFSFALLLLAACAPPKFATEETLGEALFSDTSLSKNRTQACATCHDPAHAFVDARLRDGEMPAVSIGDDGVSLGDRNAPTVTYAASIGDFHVGQRKRFNKQNANRNYEGPLGGAFWDGRAASLTDQAGGPPLNPLEMGMADQKAVVARLRENADYEDSFTALFGHDTWKDDAQTYTAATKVISAFERTDTFAPFDSRYDRFLRGELELSFMELSGKSLFFSQFANCSICHQLYSNGDPTNSRKETFTGSEFHNIGVPVNEAVRAKNGVTVKDLGLGAVPGMNATLDGQFKTPTLRNVAVTGPYMHNGVFKDLRTVVEFYAHFSDAEGRVNNPETGAPWAQAEVPETVATDLLKVGDTLTDAQLDGLVCFLRALTDQRYEPLIPSDGLICVE